MDAVIRSYKKGNLVVRDAWEEYLYGEEGKAFLKLYKEMSVETGIAPKNPLKPVITQRYK